MSWTDQNELMRLGKKMLDATGSNTPSEKSMISQLASSTGVAYNVAREAYVKSVLDPLLQEKVRKSMSWLINANFIPEFVNGDAQNADLDNSVETSAIRPDGIAVPTRMFNIDTGNLETWPSGQYVILSHSWKGQEISYSFISKIKDNLKKKEIYEMVQNDPDEEASRFARFQTKKFQHLEAGKSDVQLLKAQCTQDVQAQINKIDSILSRSGIRSNTRELLVQLAELKKATWKAKATHDSSTEKGEELKLRTMASNRLEREKKDTGLEDSEIPNKEDPKKKLEEELDQAKSELDQAKKQEDQAKEQLKKVTEDCKIMDEHPALRSALEDLLVVLERKKSMNKIEGSILEAKRILDMGLFPQKDQKRYLWNDTCCINKGDANELNQSLAMMGEWYNNADFCLVHLDTADPTEWVDTWDHLETPANAPEFHSFGTVKSPNWATRGWTLQELVLSKMTFYVNNLWQPLARPTEGLGPYYYHCSYLSHHIQNIAEVPPRAKSILQDSASLRELMDTGEKIDYISYGECSEKWRRLIGILDYLGVHFPRDMDDDNASAYIRKTISFAALDIESRLKKESPDAQRLRSLFTDLGFDMSSIQAQARDLIKILAVVLAEDCQGAIDRDREQVSKFTNVPPDECSRGLSRSSHPAHTILSLASHRRCTVPIDRVYSLMGVLGVKFAAFHAEGPIKALCRLLDEVVINTNDISIFNWGGKDLGSPIRGRSLYPSSLKAFSPEDIESQLTARQNGELAKASKEKRYDLQDTESRLSLLLRGTIDFVKQSEPKDVPVELIRSILGLVEKASLKDLRPQLENLAKLLFYVQNTARFEEEYRPKGANNVVGDGKATQSSGNIASRFGIKTPQVPQIPQFSAPKIKVGGFSSLYGKKSAPEPDPPKESPNTAAATQPPVHEERKFATLVDEVTDWISTQKDVQNVPDELKLFFKELKAPKAQTSDGRSVGQQKPKTAKTSPSDIMICPNPITLTTSGIEGVFDIQRVVITMQNDDELRYQVQTAVNENQKITGQCTISTGLSAITVNFSCAAVDLGKQLNVCDVVQETLFAVKKEEGEGASAQAEAAQTAGQESTSYYNKLTSLSSGFMRQGPEATNTTETENVKQDTQGEKAQDVKAQTQASDKTEEQQRQVSAMLDFVQETDVNLIVGEWVLARFTGAEGAKWFLCQLELGSTQNYYGRRIATDEIDFKTVVPEPGLVKHWNNYMHHKKSELCRVVSVLIQGRDARKYAEEVAGSEKDKDGQIKTGAEDDSDDESPDPKKKLVDFIVRRGTDIGAGIVQTVTDRWGKRLDDMLSDTILQKVPKELRAAIMNLNNNEDLLPAMFLSGVKVHMF